MDYILRVNAKKITKKQNPHSLWKPVRGFGEIALCKFCGVRMFEVKKDIAFGLGTGAKGKSLLEYSWLA